MLISKNYINSINSIKFNKFIKPNQTSLNLTVGDIYSFIEKEKTNPRNLSYLKELSTLVYKGLPENTVLKRNNLLKIRRIIYSRVVEIGSNKISKDLFELVKKLEKLLDDPKTRPLYHDEGISYMLKYCAGDFRKLIFNFEKRFKENSKFNEYFDSEYKYLKPILEKLEEQSDNYVIKDKKFWSFIDEKLKERELTIRTHRPNNHYINDPRNPYNLYFWVIGKWNGLSSGTTSVRSLLNIEYTYTNDDVDSAASNSPKFHLWTDSPPKVDPADFSHLILYDGKIYTQECILHVYTVKDILELNKTKKIDLDKQLLVWQQSGKLPGSAVYTNLIRVYLETDPQYTKDQAMWKRKLEEWNKNITAYADVSSLFYLYSMLVTYSQQQEPPSSFFNLISLLLSASKEKEIDDVMFKISAWICLKSFKTPNGESYPGIDLLKNLYKDHFDETIISDKNDFTIPNTRYTKLAKGLRDYKIIDNPYKLQIHTLRQEEDSVTYQPIHTIPLEDLILSRDGTELFNLSASEKFSKSSRGLFFNINTVPKRFFCNRPGTKIPSEVTQIRRNSKYSPFFNKLSVTEDTSPRLKKSTIDFIAEFINKAYFIYGEGVLADDDPTGEKFIQACDIRLTRYFEEFYKQYLRLPEAEEEKLNDQIIVDKKNNIYKFSDFIMKSQNYLVTTDPVSKKDKFDNNADCNNEIILPLFILVIDYQPTRQFRPYLENLAAEPLDYPSGARLLAVMRKNSRHVSHAPENEESTISKIRHCSL